MNSTTPGDAPSPLRSDATNDGSAIAKIGKNKKSGVSEPRNTIASAPQLTNPTIAIHTQIFRPAAARIERSDSHKTSSGRSTTSSPVGSFSGSGKPTSGGSDCAEGPASVRIPMPWPGRPG